MPKLCCFSYNPNNQPLAQPLMGPQAQQMTDIKQRSVQALMENPNTHPKELPNGPAYHINRFLTDKNRSALRTVNSNQPRDVENGSLPNAVFRQRYNSYMNGYETCNPEPENYLGYDDPDGRDECADLAHQCCLPCSLPVDAANFSVRAIAGAADASVAATRSKIASIRRR